jgi:hypothetical protein
MFVAPVLAGLFYKETFAMSKTLTQARLKEVLSYNENTGILAWKVDKRSVKKGTIAGSITNSDGYVHVGIDGKLYQGHRLAWLYTYGAFPTKVIDHINHNRTDNRINNLRDVSVAENNKNRRSYGGIVGYRNFGIRWVENNKKYRVHIYIDNVQKHLGYFKDFFEGCCVGARTANLLRSVV